MSRKSPTKIGSEFLNLVSEAANETEGEYSYPKGAPDNLIILTKNYDCYIYYLVSEAEKKHWWGINESKIIWLRECKKKFGIAFLELVTKGYLLRDEMVNDFFYEIKPTEKGVYNFGDNQLQGRNLLPFNSIEEFMGLLSYYKTHE